MANDSSPLANDIRELIDKSIEVNKVFLKESTRLLKLATTPGQKKTTAVFNPDFLTEAFNAYAKMNIRHMKNMLDLSATLMRQAAPQEASDNEQEPSPEPNPSKPVFELTGTAPAGGAITLHFVLDNNREAPVDCTLTHSPFALASGENIDADFKTEFSPQSFTLNQKEQKRIQILISIPDHTSPGMYVSSVQVKGFEPLHFAIRLIITESTPEKKSNNGSKKRSKGTK